MTRTTRSHTASSRPRKKFVAIASGVDNYGTPYAPGQCAVAEYLSHKYPELHRIFVDEDGRIAFTDTRSGNRYRWKVRSMEYQTWLIGFDRGQVPDYEMTVELDIKDATVENRAARQAKAAQTREYIKARDEAGRAPKKGSKHGKRARRPKLVHVSSS